jgi:tripartite-type tricarboxylate transporter receptor subunit TctC
LRESLAPEETRARISNLGAEIKIGTPAEFGQLLADELAQWISVAKSANIKVD